ncbi:MAG: sugar phosphate isomerase/epimerase [Oscillospiraceae bacterium]|nr:sugar phosphate isomerase/epimerase [Oscillospiraceae bacterium]
MKYALHSVSYAGIWQGQAKLSIEDFIQKAAWLGYGGVEIMAKRPHFSPIDIDDAKLRSIGELLKNEGLECACIAGYTDFLLGGDSMVAAVELQIMYVERLCAMAKELGCNLVRVFTGYENKNMNYQRQWKICADALKECAKRAAKHGVAIGVQNHHDIGAEHHSMKDFIADVGEDNCLPMFDAWVPAQMGADLKEAVSSMGRIAYTTAADYVRVPKYNYNPDLVAYSKGNDMLRAVKMGDGFIDYREFFKALISTGYDGYIAYEICSPIRGGGSIEVLDSYAKHFLDYMNGFLL